VQVVGQFEILHAKSLAPLVKARGFGMTLFKQEQTEHYPLTLLAGKHPGK
jgi:hypothetical protein